MKERLVKTHIRAEIGEVLDKAADAMGFTFLEYIRKVLGEHAASVRDKIEPNPTASRKRLRGDS